MGLPAWQPCIRDFNGTKKLQLITPNRCLLPRSLETRMLSQSSSTHCITITALQNHPKGGSYIKVGISFFQVTRDRTMGNGPRLHPKRFGLDVRKIFFAKSVARLWNMLSKQRNCHSWKFSKGVPQKFGTWRHS